MTGELYLDTQHTGAGRHKVYVIGHADGHISNWRGCAFRRMTVAGQPARGFERKAEAEAFALALTAEQIQQIKDAAYLRAGTAYGDENVCLCGRAARPEGRLSVTARLRVGPAENMPAGGWLRFGHYGSGETAIEIMADDGERETVATVSIVPYGSPDPGPAGVWLKGWGENKGIPEAMEKAGIVHLTGRRHPTGHVEAQHGELSATAIRARDRDFRNS